MNWYIDGAVWLIKAYRRAREKKARFFGLAILIFFANTAVLAAYDLLPEAAAPDLVVETENSSSTPAPNVVLELPTRIEIPALGLSAAVVNPTSTVIAELDRALLSGAVRYPTSAQLGETGNVVLFGHSSYLPVVGNPAFKTFNGIQKLRPGDTVMVFGARTAYTYRVRSMEKVSANDAGISLLTQGSVLTLSTCNSFGEKSDRFVVTADLVGSAPVSTL